MKLAKIMAGVVAGVVAMSTMAVAASAYSADLCVQTGAWTYRNALGDDLHAQLTKWVDNVAVDCGATFTDATVEYDGTYTVSITGYDFAADSTDPLNLLFISTDIALSDDVTWTVDEVNLVAADGTKTALEGATGLQNPKTKDTIDIQIQNKWNSDIAVLDYANPTSGFEVTFTIAGIGEAPANDETTAPTEDETTPEVGDSNGGVGDSEEVPGDSSGNNNNGGNDDTNENTGVALVVVPVVLAGGALVASAVLLKKKSK